tara:strand:- start:1982 stop:4147 length:2166 start_codon:yes stop_codon:yes gene_type:complete
MNVLEALADSIDERLKVMHFNNKAGILNKLEATDVAERSAGFVIDAVLTDATLTSCVCQIGASMMRALGMATDTRDAAKVGAFLFEVYMDLDLIALETRPNGKDMAYFIKAANDDLLADLIEQMSTDKVENLPKITPPADWTSSTHGSGVSLVKNAKKYVKDKLTPNDTPILFKLVNKAQNIGWRVNKELLKTFVSMSNNEELAEYLGDFAFDYLEPEETKVVKRSKKLEVKFIKSIAQKLKNGPFYHIYNLDFRGRAYPNSAFFHEQSSDNAKGLLLLDESKPLSENGFYWLSVHTSNCWGEDKISLDARANYTYKNLEEWVSYARAPLENKGWLKADKCWSFLAACIELKNIVAHCDAGKDVSTYSCNLPIFIDGSNNGVQHLAALSLDAEVAPLVNLVPQAKVGDVYMHVANKAWEQITTDLNPALEEKYEELHATLREFSLKYEGTKGAERADHRKVFAKWKTENKDDLMACAPNFWAKVTDPKKQRKVCKRPVMTLGYGGTEFGFKDQVLQDTKSIDKHFRGMPFSWAQYMGSLIYDICRGSATFEAALPGPANMLNLFETLADRASDEGKRLAWTVPFTGMPVLQQYRKYREVRQSIHMQGVRYQITLRLAEEQYLDTAKQKTAASPNIIHSFDAAHLAMTVTSCDFVTATVHDSFGCLPGDMEELFITVRETFSDFYTADPLKQLLTELDAMDLMPERGSLDVNDIIKSDYAFA